MVFRFLFLSALSATFLLATLGAQVGRSLKINDKTSAPYQQYLPQGLTNQKIGIFSSFSMAGEKAMDRFTASKNRACDG